MRIDTIKTDPKPGETAGEWATQTLNGFLGGVRVGMIGLCEGGFDAEGRPKGEVSAERDTNIVQLGFHEDGQINWVLVREGSLFFVGADLHDKKISIRYQAQALGFIQLIQFTREQFALSQNGVF